MQLSPAEILVLDAPNVRRRAELLKANLRHLVATGHLEPGRRSTSSAKTGTADPAYRIAKPLPRGTPADLAVVLALAGHSGQHTLASLMRAARSKWGGNLDRFRTDIVLPALVAKGLVYPRTRRILLIFPRTRYVRTDAGETLDRRIATLMRQARELPALMSSDPARAAAIATAAGTLVLMLPELQASLGDIAHVRRLNASSPGVGSDGWSSSSFAADQEALGAIDDFDGAFDAAEPSSSDSDGGDGGGGDGGGGGD